MDIKLMNIKIRDVFQGYINDDELGVFGYKGKLNIRPKYQREYVYQPKERDMVINSVKNKYPLNVMYWSANEDGTYEVLDGQQRTISICEYVAGEYSIDNKYFFNMTDDEKNKILDYELSVYKCDGTEKEKLDWFKTVNIAGLKLSDQELRNAVYTGPWLSSAKEIFSKTNAPAHAVGKDYLSGSPLRQEILEKAIKWICISKGISVEEYMARNQEEADATELWIYFNNIITWIKAIFPNYRKEMKSVDWGALYHECKDSSYNAIKIEEQIKDLMMNDDVTKKAGAYYYALTGKEKYLNIRAFTPSMARGAYEKQKGICPSCYKKFDLCEMEADHVTPWSQGGKTSVDNCKMLCRECNRRKSDK